MWGEAQSAVMNVRALLISLCAFCLMQSEALYQGRDLESIIHHLPRNPFTLRLQLKVSAGGNYYLTRQISISQVYFEPVDLSLKLRIALIKYNCVN